MAKVFKKHVKKDWYLDKGPNGQSMNRGFKTCYVIKHTGTSEMIPHPVFHNDQYLIQPYSLCNVPIMVAQGLDGDEDYEIISKELGDKFIAKARDFVIKNNQQVYDDNEKYRGVKGYKPKKMKSRLITKYGRNVSPYTCYLDYLAKRSKKVKDKKE